MYPYRCTACGHKFEKIQSFSADPETICPKCGGPLERVLTAPRLNFKGAGWYINDYAPKSSGSSDASSGPGDSSSSSGDSPSDSKSDSQKSADKPAASSTTSDSSSSTPAPAPSSSTPSAPSSTPSTSTTS